MHTSDALGRLHNFTDTPGQKDVIPLNFLQHFTPHYIEQAQNPNSCKESDHSTLTTS